MHPMRFEFEKIKSPIYPAYLHVGDYSIALDPTLILSLKKGAVSCASSTFEEILKMIAGENRYLVEMMKAAEASFDEKSDLIKRLCGEIASL